MSIKELRQLVEGEIVDYQTVMHCLREYKKPRDKLSLLIKNGSLIRIKKGVYIFGQDYQKRLLSQEVLANVIYSPSYISLESALAVYGLIPERVHTMTSVCLDRSKNFTTPIGTFMYFKRPKTAYPIGVHLKEVEHQGSYLIATPEKALIDLLYSLQSIQTVGEMKEHLYENMRMEPSDMKKLNKKLLSDIMDCYAMTDVIIKAIYD